MSVGSKTPKFSEQNLKMNSRAHQTQTKAKKQLDKENHASRVLSSKNSATKKWINEESSQNSDESDYEIYEVQKSYHKSDKLKRSPLQSQKNSINSPSPAEHRNGAKKRQKNSLTSEDSNTQNLLRNKLIDDSDEKAQSTLNSGSKEHNKLNLRNGRQNKNVKLAANENSISVDPFDEDAAANLYNNNPNKDRHVGRNKQDRRRNSYSRNRQNEAANSIDLDEALSNDPYSKTSYYLRENGATREKKASNFLSKEDSIDKRDHFGSPESDNGTNYTRTLKTELKQNVERVREMKRQNSKQSLRDEDSLIESPQEQSATQKLSSSNLNNTKKKKANAKLHVTEARSQHSVSQPRVEIQSKMDFINSLFSQLNCDDEEQSNPKKESRSSYLIESKSMKTTKSPNKSRISEKGGSLAKKEQSDRVEELEDNYVYREDKLNKKIIKTKNQDEEEKRAFGRNGSLQKKINLKESSAQTKKVQKQSRRLNGEEEEAEDKEEDECSNVDNLKNEQILQNYKNARDLELVSPKTQLKEFGNSQYYSNADLRTPTGNEIRSIKVKHQHQKGSLPEDYLEETDQKRQYSKNKPKYHENQGDDLAEEPQNRDFISKNLRKSYKPPLPQPKEGRNKLVDEDWFNNSDNEVEKHTQSRASHQRSSTNSNRPKKDYIAINKEKLKSSARKLSKNYDRLLKNLDQDLKPFVKVLSEQANQTVRTFKSMKSNKDSGQKSLSHISSPLKPSNNLSSPNNYVSSASSKNNRRKNQDLDGSVSQSVVHDRSYEQICQTFTETANNMKHFESEINNLTKQISKAAQIMQETLEKLENYRGTDSRANAHRSVNYNHQEGSTRLYSEEEDLDLEYDDEE